MSCERWRDAVSALADGEDAGIDARLVEAHLARCGPCRGFRDDAHAVRRAYAVDVAEPMPDLRADVARADRAADRAGGGVIRGLLALVTVLIVALSLRALVLGDEPSTSEHAARHLGAFTAAYGAGLALVVWRPARARSVLPVSCTLAVALVLTAVVDIAEGRIPLSGEAVHVPEVASVALVWALAVPSPRRRARAARTRPGRIRRSRVGTPGGTGPTLHPADADHAGGPV